MMRLARVSILLCLGLLFMGACDPDEQEALDSLIDEASEEDAVEEAKGLLEVKVNSESEQLAVGERIKLTCHGSYKDDSLRELRNHSWSISEHLVQEGDGDYRIELLALTSGEAEVGCKLGDVSDRLALTVNPKKITDFFATPSQLVAGQGELFLVDAYAQYSDQSISKISDAELSIEVPAGLTLKGYQEELAAFQFQANELGSYQIILKLGEQVTREVAVEVLAVDIGGISLNYSQLHLEQAASKQFQASAVYVASAKSQDLTDRVVWSSSDPEIADFSASESGLLIAKNLGDVTITSRFGDLSAQAEVRVGVATLEDISLSLNPDVFASGQESQIKITGHFAGEIERDLTSMCTYASKSALLGLDAKVLGLVRGNNPGSGKISVKCLQLTKEFTLEVAEPVFTRIVLTEPGDSDVIYEQLSIGAGYDKTYQVLGIFSDGTEQNVLSDSELSILNPTTASFEVITVDGEPLLKLSGLAEADTELFIVSGPAAANIAVEVTTKSLISLHIYPQGGLTQLASGNSLPIRVKGVFSDDLSTEVDLSASTVVWYHSFDDGVYDNALFFVNNEGSSAGYLTGLNEGTGKIHARKGDVVGELSFEILPPVVTDVSISADATNLLKGGSANLSGTATYSDGSTKDLDELCSDHTLSWTRASAESYLINPTSPNDQICSSGTYTVTASSEGLDTYTLNVTPDGGGDDIDSNTLEIVVRSPCTENATTAAFGTVDGHANLYCWYQGNQGDSCTTTCSNAGRSYQTYANANVGGGSGTTQSRCSALIQEFTAFSAIDMSTNYNGNASGSLGLGCAVGSVFSVLFALNFVAPATNAGDSEPDHYRICACSP